MPPYKKDDPFPSFQKHVPHLHLRPSMNLKILPVIKPHPHF